MNTSEKPEYKMSISLNVLEHLGINLYSNVPAVITEVIANSWDADATEVHIDFKPKEDTIIIRDDGIGMSEDDINNKYLLVGYQRRGPDKPTLTEKERPPMGRKGIGKLSLFSIAEKVYVYTKTKNKENNLPDEETNAFLMDAEEIRKKINKDDPTENEPYRPEALDFDNSMIITDTGTTLKIMGLNKRLTKTTDKSLRARIARRFNILDGQEFQVYLNGKKISYSDRDYFHKARFLFQYGDVDYTSLCSNLDKDSNGKECVFIQNSSFSRNGKPSKNGKFKITGWIAVAESSKDLHSKDSDGTDSNLNKIAIIVRGKVALEDILSEYTIGGLVSKYLYGEIQADFLDEDGDDDIATSSRQKIIETDPRYIALRKFLEAELSCIESKTNSLKEKAAIDEATNFNAAIKEWYEELSSSLKKQAKKYLGKIATINTDNDNNKAELYTHAILAFEKLEIRKALEIIDTSEPENLQILLSAFGRIDEIEAINYHEIVTNRLDVIGKLKIMIENNSLEREIQEYLFDHLWLLDPAWERATERSMEESIHTEVDNIKKNEPAKIKRGRIDIRYRRISGGHVIIELKRPNVVVVKEDLEKQINRYIEAIKEKLNNADKGHETVTGICIVGEYPKVWRQVEISTLEQYNIRVLTYQRLIIEAEAVYSEFLEAHKELTRLRRIIDEIIATTKSN